VEASIASLRRKIEEKNHERVVFGQPGEKEQGRAYKGNIQ
jgi:hypothetical protein